MANITINSLSTQSINDGDAIIKSNSDGVLSKTTMLGLKQYVNGGQPALSLADYFRAKNNPISLNLSSGNGITLKTAQGTSEVTVWETDVTLPVSGTYMVEFQTGAKTTGGGGFVGIKVSKNSTLVMNNNTVHQSQEFSLLHRSMFNYFQSGTYHVQVSIRSGAQSGTMSVTPDIFSFFNVSIL